MVGVAAFSSAPPSLTSQASLPHPLLWALRLSLCIILKSLYAAMEPLSLGMPLLLATVTDIWAFLALYG